MRRASWLAAVAAVAAGCGGSHGQRLATGDLPRSPARLHLSSPGFSDGSGLPRRYTCDGAGDEPAVRVGAVPPKTRELVLVVSDPDAPGGTYVHLTRYGLSGRASAVDHRGREGTNSAGSVGWTAPCPPRGDGDHRYVWSAYALREPSGLDRGANPSQVAHALGHGVLAKGTITARYGR